MESSHSSSIVVPSTEVSSAHTSELFVAPLLVVYFTSDGRMSGWEASSSQAAPSTVVPSVVLVGLTGGLSQFYIWLGTWDTSSVRPPFFSGPYAP